MKARLFIVNKDTIINTLDSMEVSVLVPEPKGKSGWYETLTDIISDLMQVEIGDYIFLWESDRNIGGERVRDNHTEQRDAGICRTEGTCRRQRGRTC